MVFESIITEVINKFLGKFVENLDQSQLRIGIFGGDVVLKDLVLKSTALDGLDLPIRAKYGNLGSLTLKIPWTNLYSAPVVAIIEELYLLIVPNTQIAYSAEKEEKYDNDRKQAELQKVEDAKKMVKEKDKPKGGDTFVEKLVTQIIKNIQVKIMNIHVRYEDSFSIPNKPFAVGVTLHSISVHSTDEKWEECIVQGSEFGLMVFKMLDLKSLAVYFNCDTKLFPENDIDATREMFSKTLAKYEPSPANKYVLAPINMRAQLRINPKPETDGTNYKTPKIQLGITLERLAVGITKEQYRSIFGFVDAIGLMIRASMFQKYRPKSRLHENAREWWQFAYTCVLEHDIRRVRRNWSWEHMREHRQLCRRYAHAYRNKLKRTLSPDLEQDIRKCEKFLDVFNLIVIREAVEFEVEREALKKHAENVGWFRSWFLKSPKAEDGDTMSAAAIMKKFEKAMTAEEKKKLFMAIDYQDNILPAQYPVSFVENCFDFVLKALTVEILDEDYPISRVLFAELENVVIHLEQRPAANAIKMLATINSFGVFGMQQDSIVPHMVSYQPLKHGTKLVDLLVETNPLDGKCDQLVQVTARPLEIVYDGVTILKLVDIFTPPQSTVISELQAAAVSKLPDFKEMSAVGMQYAIEKHMVLDINIDLSSSYIILPQSGLYDRLSLDQDIILVNLGHLSMSSVNQDRSSLPTVKELHDKGLRGQEILQEMASKCYDKYVIRIDEMQILMVMADEDWEKTLASGERCAMHLLEPTSLEILLLTCLIPDATLASAKIEGILPSVTLNVEDERILHIMSILISLAPPEPEETEEAAVPEYKLDTISRVSTTTELSRLATERTLEQRMNISSSSKTDQGSKYTDFVQRIDFQMDFILKDLIISVFKSSEDDGDSNLIVAFEVKRVVFSLVQQTHDLSIYVNVGTIQLNFADSDGQIGMVNIPTAEGEDKYMLLMKMIQANRESPEFFSTYGGVLQRIEVDVVGMTLLLHQEALLALWDYVRNLLNGVNRVKPQRRSTQRAHTSKPSLSTKGQSVLIQPRHTPTLAPVPEVGGAISLRKRPRVKKPIEVTDVKVVAKLFSFNIEMLSKGISCAQFTLEGGGAEITVKNSYTEVMVKLKNFSAYDPNPVTRHHEILSVMGNEAFSLQLVIFNPEMIPPDSPDAVDISIIVKTSAIRIFYINWFISRLMNFVRPFQEVQRMIEEAAREAAEQAILNAREAYNKAARISLDVIFQAPVIIVPANSRSIDALYFDMGTLIVKNRFETLYAFNEEGKPAVVDEITLYLQDVKLSRVKLNYDDQVVSELTLLKPLSGNVIVRRNLSNTWYTCIADIDISGRLESLVLSLCEDDFHVIMRIPSENLQEEDVIVEIVKDRTYSHEEKMDEEVSPSELELIQKKARNSTMPLPPASYRDQILTVDPVTTAVKFTFTLDSFILDLYTSSGLPEEGDIRMNTQEKGLGRFSLNFISAKGRVFSDLTMSTSLLLLDCLLDDTRPDSKSKIKRFMQRKFDNPEESSGSQETEATYRSMVDVTFQKKNDDMFVDVRVFGFDLVLSTEYLMKIADFFVGWSYERKKKLQTFLPSENKIEDDTALPSITIEKRSSRDRDVTSLKTAIATETPGIQDQGYGTVTLNIHVEKPDIVMVEGLEDINTKALVMNTEITLKLRMSPKHQCICGAIKDLQIYSCVYNPIRRLDTIYEILRPCSISVAGSTPGDEGLHIDICITPIRLSISAGTLELLTNVQKGLNIPEETLDPTKGEIDHSKIWEPVKFGREEFWFLKADAAAEAVESMQNTPKPVEKGELCILSVSSIVLTVESGIGTHTIPIILVEMSFNGAVNNWSSQLVIDSCMSLEIKYYNTSLAMWEPLLEPIELQQESGAVGHVPWELRLQLQVNPDEDERPSSPSSDIDIEDLPPPKMTIEISSKENLELTLSKTCINVLSGLVKSFQTAISGDTKKLPSTPPFTVKNDSGLAIAVLLEKSPFQVYGSDPLDALGYKEVMLESGAKVELCLSDPDIEDVWNLGLQKDSIEEDSLALEQYLRIKVIERNCQLSLPVKRADKRYFSLKHRGEGNEPWGLVSDVQVKDGGTIITIRSIIQIHNHFNMPINVYYMTKRGNEVECIGTVEHKEKLNVPLYAVYTPTNELFFSVQGYTVSIEPFIWKDLQNLLSLSKHVQCDPKVNLEEKEPFIMKIIGEMEQVFFENTTRHTMLSTCYNIHLRPTVIFKNHLPLPVVVCLANTSVEESLEPGQRLQLPTAEPGKCNLILRIPEYLEKEWSCDHELETNPHEYTVWTFSAYDSQLRVNLDLGMRTVLERGSTIMTVYCPYWMLNKTGLMLCYRKSRKLGNETSTGSPLKQGEETANILYHPENFKGPVLFSFKAKSFFGKKKGSIKVEDSDWSDKFPLDVAGSSGLVSCKHPDMVYKIGVHIQLTFSSLTKQVTFTPYYVLLNNATYPIEVQEGDRPADPWIHVEPNGCSALWPRSSKSHLRARVVGTKEVTADFSYDSVYTTLLRLDNKYGGLNVDVQMAEGSIYISFMSYEHGLAPVLLMNCLDYPVPYHEKDMDEVFYLEPMTAIMFTWAKPVGSRTLVWANKKKKDFVGDLRKDGIGEFATEGDGRAFWVSFLDGMQRVLLFTPSLAVARDAQAAGELERVDQEITIAIHGVGVSLVNDFRKQETLYCSLASSGVVWEACKPTHRRYRQLNSQDSRLIEEAYDQHQKNQQYVLDAISPVVTLDNGMEVDFLKGEIVKPSRRLLRRSYSTGLWIQMKTSKHQVSLHAKVNRLQVDNQMADNLFPVVVAPVPLPRSISSTSGFKPFLELSIVKRIMEHSPVIQYKYFKVLVQEFHIKLDIGFINGMVQFFEPQAQDEEEYVRFKEDLKLVHEPLMSHALLQSSAEQKNFYDLLHFSPLKIHLSFSLSSTSPMSGTGGGEEAVHFINVLMQSLGVTLTDMQDVVFKLAYFERQYTFLTQRQLTAEVNTHYLGQLLRQLYVLVLGLDVLGNPYGLVVGMAQGVEDLFYEPFQGAIQGPGEFAEGLVLGVRSLVGHTVGGAAGAMSRIAGAMGKGVAALTFDKDYQRKRREAIAHRPSNVHMGIAQSSKGLVMGVVAGVSGVFTKPVSGARQEGVEGFFKGVGKGVVGLVTRPTAGIIDFASGTLEQVKRAADPNEEVRRMRPPRFMHPDGQIRPYARHEAEGSMILNELEKGRYSTTDAYAFHVGIVAGAKDILLLTDKRVMYIVHNDVFGGWQVEWEYTWESLAAPPTEVDRGIYLTTGESQKKVLGLFRSADKGGKIIMIENKDELQYLLKKMNEIIEQ